MEEGDNRPKWGRGCSKGCLMPQRIVVSIMGFFALITAYTHRVSISHVITQLAIPIHKEVMVAEGVCPKEPTAAAPANEGTYAWSEQLQGFILGSFYFGYLITHLPAGVIADKYGAKWVLGSCILISALCTFGSPLAIDLGHQWGLMGMRVLMGFAQGLLFPSITTLLSAWVPGKERATLGTFCYSGVTAGTVVSNIGSGLMLHSFQWPVTLYVFGAVGMLWFLIFSLLCTSEPDRHPCIKPKEMAYLNEQIGKRNKGPRNIPWKAIMSSKVTWAVIVSQVGHDWGYFVMITCLPKYMADVLQFSIRSNGFVTAMPFIAMFIATNICGFIADCLIRSGKMSIGFQRKLFTFIGAFGPGMFTVIASYAGCNKTLVVALFVMAMLTMGPYYAGQKLSPMDMSPTYSGTLMAITNGLGSLAGLASPPVVGLMTPHATMNEWRRVFWLGFIILVLSAIVFAIWGSAEKQPFDPTYTGEKEEKK